MGDSQRIRRPEEMATTSTAVSTVPAQLQEEPVQPIAVITLRPTRAQERKKVVWTEDTVDNENMNKKKSKCCCIYEKPRRFGESDSETSDDECEHCSGHVERRRHKHHQQASTSAQAQSATTTTTDGVEPATTVTLKPGEPSAPPDNPEQPAASS
ncbi:E3 ubiquitin-protein ligase PPP1R11 [Amyelois transitella]|uniref:E3 ubiquitin-protein ligase PPP1R11 n=1 Tax=Amyelois transitella TaxID=680683 RepID=UPI00067B9982|nr:E3 ubiquitin-protein ligase PPP1R11 [Amyelois transitella]